ncbi:MAG: bifunctional phosphoribosylaminoimidazolecarboxamide formyltransferase/IMP cyclohydrolase [Pseudomonadota bacterium]
MTDPASAARLMPRRALLSVSDKTGLTPLAQALHAAGCELVSTGGTARALREAGLPVREVAELTGFPEMMDGRVKTLHPAVHGGLLARRDDADHMRALADQGFGPIDLLCVNLYPFEATVASGADMETCIENIDIGGPAMIRAAAKNADGVVVLTDPADYAEAMAALAEGGVAAARRRRLSAAAYARTAAYDAAVSAWMAEQAGEAAPRRRAFAGELAQTLRYGENPHQSAAFYRSAAARPGVASAVQLQGKALSWNNINDTDAAYECAAEFDPAEGPALVIVKHANPCGAARGDSVEEAWDRALACDPVSAFGGIVALNRPLDAAAAERIASIFTEVVIAPQVTQAARAVFAAKPNLRLLEAGALPDPAGPGLSLRQVAGGYLVQDRDAGRLDPAALTLATRRAPTAEELSDLLFAWRVAKHVKSNAIVYARGGATVGVGAGQMSRVDSTRLAAAKAAAMAEAAGAAQSFAKGSVVASDAFFPFADGLLAAAEAGATAVIQPGGSRRDDEVIAAADDAGLAMVFTGMRHFRH